jgi:branched-chain amino acid transport system substrate-binding protein
VTLPARSGGRGLAPAPALSALLTLLAQLTLLALTAWTTTACRSKETVRLGIVVTGEAVVAAQLAASEINASGGIQGHPLELRVIAGASSTRASLSLAAADELSLDSTVIGVVGHSNSSASLSAAQIYNARHLVQIAPTSSSPLLSQVGPYTFRLVPSDVHQAQFLADQIVAHGAKPRIALYFVNDDYGHALHQELRALLDHAQVPVVYDAPYSHEELLPEPVATARRIAQEAPDLLVWLGRSAQLRQLLPELRAAIPDIRILASDGIDEVMSYLNQGGILTGVQYVSFLDTHAPRAALDDLRTRIRAARGLPLTAEAAFTYDGVMFLASAARSAGIDRVAIRDYLAGVGTRHPPYEGITGTIAFDANGDPRPAYNLVEITADGSRVVDTSRPEVSP